jgi:hypothetical protein
MVLFIAFEALIGVKTVSYRLWGICTGLCNWLLLGGLMCWALAVSFSSFLDGDLSGYMLSLWMSQWAGINLVPVLAYGVALYAYCINRDTIRSRGCPNLNRVSPGRSANLTTP